MPASTPEISTAKRLKCKIFLSIGANISVIYIITYYRDKDLQNYVKKSQSGGMIIKTPWQAISTTNNLRNSLNTKSFRGIVPTVKEIHPQFLR